MLFSEISKMERPRVIAFVGYMFFAAAILMVLGGVMALVVNAIIARFGGMPEVSGPFNFMFANFRYFALGEVIVGILLFLVSCNFLLGKNWTRIVLQVFLVFSMIFTIVFCILWGDSWIRLAPNIVIKLYGLFIVIYSVVYWGVVSGITIVFLNGKTVKQFCSKNETN